MDFIEKLSADSLNLSEELFTTYMDGDTIPDGTNMVYMCDGLRIIHENSEMLKKLKVKQDKCGDDVEELQQRIAQFREA